MGPQETRIVRALCKRKYLASWIIACLEKDNKVARILALDLISDLWFSNISQEKVEVILDELDDHIRKKGQGETTELHDCVANFGTERPHCLCSGIELDVSKRMLSRVLEVAEIVSYHLKETYSYYIDDRIPEEAHKIFFSICRDFGRAEDINSVLNKEKSQFVLRVLNQADPSSLGPLRGRLPLFWFTLTEAVEQIKRSASDSRLPCCDNICNALGRPTEKNAHIAELRFQAEDSVYLCPTIIDSDFSLPFISVFGKWGRCLALRETKEGLREGIHSEIRDYPSSFELHYLGATSEEIPEPSREQMLTICKILEYNLQKKGFESSTILRELKKALGDDA